MNHSIRLRAEAENDILEAATWYEGQRSGLGHDFLDVIESIFQEIVEHPSRFPVLHRNAHRALLSRFPFGVFFRVEDNGILVIAVMHASRNPERWRERI